MTTLVIAEKPSVGRDLTRVLPGAFQKHENYLESDSHVVTWAVGHLVQLAEPWIGTMNQSFVQELTRAGIPVTTSFQLLGEHDWAGWEVQLHRSWPLLLQSLSG